MRASTIITETDQTGPYAVEIFDTDQPKNVVVCVHGRGVRRWDGEHFFYNVAEHYPKNAFLLCDQNQFDEQEVCQLTPLPIATKRVQKLITLAKEKHPNVPIIVMAHSLGCAITTRLDLAGIEKVIFVTPAAGIDTQKLIARYGEDIANGKTATSSDGITRYFSKDYFDSLKGMNWNNEYQALLKRYQPVYAFEAGEEEIVTDDRLEHRNYPFAKYQIIPNARHNLTGQPLQTFFAYIDTLL